MSKPLVRTSRRIPSLKDSEIDHSIALEDHDPLASFETVRAEDSAADRPLGDDGEDSPASNGNLAPLTPSESQAPLRDAAAPPSRDDKGHDRVEGAATTSDGKGVYKKEEGINVSPSTTTAGPSTAEQPRVSSDSARKSKASAKRSSRRLRSEAESEIDILYENERGGFLCGIPLFSGAALGNLDPPPWTNSLHKPSPTDTKTAQVPDPSWEWAWPEWRVNHDSTIDADKEGWEYSFMFARNFSWHGPKWWNSFVRRRAWIRRRVKKGLGYQVNDPHLLNPDYFTVSKPQSQRTAPSIAGSAVASIIAGSKASAAECDLHAEDTQTDGQQDAVEIETTEVLIAVLKRSRIDREKLDAVQSYLEHATDDLLELQDHMHEIMSIFMFQASRKQLLSTLMHFHDETSSSDQKQKQKEKEKEEGSGDGASERAKNLAAAVKHADEEVRKLEYWSDVKGLAESGESRGAAGDDKGWHSAKWEGVDQSGAQGANKEELP